MEAGLLKDTCIAHLNLNLFDYLHKPDNVVWLKLSGNSKARHYFGMIHLKMERIDVGKFSLKLNFLIKSLA